MATVGPTLAQLDAWQRIDALPDGYRVDRQGPLSVLINGSHPWDEELAGLLSPDMFENPEACKARRLLRWELKPPAAAREAAFKRLCGPA